MAKQLKVILVDIIHPDTDKEEAEKRLLELENLVNTYGGIVVVKTIQKKGVPDYEGYIGKGKVLEILEIGKETGASVVVVNNLLKSRQIFNLDETFRPAEMKTWDRVDLILKIFDKHAQSAQAKLQIELASIRHMGPRIFGMGIELSRQGGAMGLRSGQGESNTEMMKRHLRTQELNILKKLKHYETIDEGHRMRRRRQNFKTVALVGYTNAGKSSLLKALTGKKTYVADQLFATLDTSIGKLYLPATSPGRQGREVLVSDTIGFIQDLPPSLIEAFKSTLAETVEADVLLHVIDIGDPELYKKIRIVEEILEQLGLSKKPKIYVFNKLDLIAPPNIFIAEEKRHTSLLKAGPDAIEKLGWYDKKHKAQALLTIKKLRKKYKDFSPVFVAAELKFNLEELHDAIRAHTRIF